VLRVRRTARALAVDGIQPTTAVLAEHLLMPAEKVQFLLDLDATSDVLSLDLPVGEDDSTTLGEFLADRTPGPESAALDQERNELIEKLLGRLTSREQEVVRRRFGLDDHSPETLEEIGEDFGLTRERIRQVQVKALKKLQASEERKQLKDYW
jgi:RNA polymerase primary sigma factor